MFNSKQWAIVIQIAMGVCFAITTRYVVKQNLPFFIRTSFPSDLSDCERFKFAFRYLAFSTMPLLVAIGKVGTARFFNMETLGGDPTAPVAPSQKAFKIAEKVLQNTLEQTVLHVLTVLALASSIDVDQLDIIPCMVLLFCFGRCAFFVGYDYNTLFRGFGFATTFLPTIAGLLYALFIIASPALFE